MRLALGVSYDGRAYQGWQSQPSRQTLQDNLELALSRFAAQKISTLCAGRTDAGVHALMQVVHFDSSVQREPNSWLRGTNAYLPHDIAVQWAQAVSADFHCRACALTRRYAYIVLESSVRPSLEHGRVGWVFQPLDLAAMQAAAGHLIGEHDFSSFRAAACQALSPIKTLLRIDISRNGSYWRFDFEASAFLHHMVRNLMGCLIMVGQHKRRPDWMREVLLARNRDAAAATFSAAGLYFVGPRYAPHWGLPDRTPLFDALPALA